MKDQCENKWITQGLKVSSKRIWFLNGLKRTTSLSRESLDYNKRYQEICNRVIKEATKRENDRYVLKAKNKTRAMWQILICRRHTHTHTHTPNPPTHARTRAHIHTLVFLTKTMMLSNKKFYILWKKYMVSKTCSHYKYWNKKTVPMFFNSNQFRLPN